VLVRGRLRSCGFPLAQTAVIPSRLRRSDPDHAPSISCATMFRYPVERSRNLAGFFNPATLLGFDTLRSFAPVRGSESPFGVVRPPAVCRASHPDNLVGGPVAQIPHPLRLRLTAGARRGSWVFSPRASRSPSGSRAGRIDTALGLCLSQVFGHRKHRHAGAAFSARRSASHGYRFGYPDAHGFCWRCRCAATATKSDAPSGTRHFSASPADPSAFVAGA